MKCHKEKQIWGFLQTFTFSSHVGFNTLRKSASLTLISSWDIDDTFSTLFADILEISKKENEKLFHTNYKNSKTTITSHEHEKFDKIEMMELLKFKDERTVFCIQRRFSANLKTLYLLMLRLKNPRHPSQLGTP